MSGASVEDRARTSVYLASSQDLKNITGKFFIDSKKRNSASFTYDSELQNQLWEISLKMIKRFL